MRPFNEREKAIIRMIASIDPSEAKTFSRVLSESFFTEASNLALLVHNSNKKVLLYIDKDDFDDFGKRAKKLAVFTELLNLVEYLVKVNYAYALPVPPLGEALMASWANHDDATPKPHWNQTDRLIFNEEGYHLKKASGLVQGEKIFNSEDKCLYEALNIDFEGSYEKVYQLLLGVLYPTEELIDFVKHDFTTKEDRVNKFNKRAAVISISIALFFGVYGVADDIFEDECPCVQLEEGQMKKLTPELQTIEEQLDSINSNTSLMRDTTEEEPSDSTKPQTN